MNSEVTYEILGKRNVNNDLNQVAIIKEHLLTDDREFTDAFYNYVDIEDYKTAKEIKLHNIKKVLAELSIKLGYDLEPVRESIFIKHSHLEGISYPIFKECLYDWLEKQEKVLSTTIFVDDHNMKEEIVNYNSHNDNHKVNHHNGEGSLLMDRSSNNLDTDFDINMMILQRSLYILKRKFEIYEKEISNVFRKHMEKNKIDYIIDIKQFSSVVNEILKEANFSLSEIKKPNDVFKAELVEILNKNNLKKVIVSLDLYMQDNRKKYNNILKEKKEKGFVKINNIDVNYNEMEDPLAEEIEKGKVEGDLLDLVNPEEIVNEEKGDDHDIDEVKEVPENISLTKKIDKENEGKENTKMNKINKMNNKNTTPGNPDEMHPNEIDNKLKLISRPENEELKKMKQTLDDDIRSFVMDRTTNTLRQSENSLPLVSGIKRSQEIQDPNFKDVMDKLKSRRKDKNKLEYLFIEILPLIFADFIHDNSNVVIIETNEELKGELRTLFDNEILSRLGDIIKYDVDEEKTSKLKDLLFERLNLEKNIQTYEDLLLKKQSVKENVVFIEQMLQKLYNQKIWIENKIKSIQEDNETINNYNDIQAVNLNLNSNVNANVKNANVNVNANANVKDITNMKPIVRKSINSPNESAIFRLNNVSKIIPKKFLSKEEVRSNALNEIFYFYSRQHQLTSRIATFDDIANKTDRMDLGEFMKFCVEFKILVKKERLVEVFKKSASSTKMMTYDEFIIALRNISVRVNDEKKQLLMKRLNRMRTELKKLGYDVDKADKNDRTSERNITTEIREVNNTDNSVNELKSKLFTGEEILEEKKENSDNENIEDKNLNQVDKNINQEENNNISIINKIENEIENEINQNKNNKDTTYISQEDGNPVSNIILPKLVKLSMPLRRQVSLLNFSGPQEVQQEISKFKMILHELKNKSYQSLLEELYIYLELDYEKSFRAKMIGFNIAFHTNDKNFRIPNEILMKGVKKIDHRTAEEIKRILKERKEEKLKEGIEKERLEKLRYYQQRKQISNVNKKIGEENDKSNLNKEDNYVSIKQKQKTYIKEKETKLTWDQLENLNYNHFISNREDDFNPTELIDEDEFDSDDDEFSLNSPNTKNNKSEKSITNNYSTKSQDKIFNYANAKLVNKNNINNKSIMSTSADKADKSLNNSNNSINNSKLKLKIKNSEKSNSPRSKQNYHDHNYFVSKTEKKAKDLEKEWEEKQAKIIQKYENMIKKSQEKVKKFNKKY